MDDLEYGPVELILAAFEGDEPDPGVFDALAELAEAGTIRVIDLVHVSRSADGEVTYREVDESGIRNGAVDLVAGGLASHEDVTELGELLAPGTSAVLLVVELLYATQLASRVMRAGGYVVDSVRIPAPVVNEVALAAAGAQGVS
jgi:uncharacterized membrane protein